MNPLTFSFNLPLFFFHMGNFKGENETGVSFSTPNLTKSFWSSFLQKARGGLGGETLNGLSLLQMGVSEA